MTPRTAGQRTPTWRDAARIIAIDMCTIYQSAVRRVLPAAAVSVDLFHVVQLAVKAVGDDTLDATGPGRHVARPGPAKEKLRRVLSPRARVTGSVTRECQVRDWL